MVRPAHGCGLGRQKALRQEAMARRGCQEEGKIAVAFLKWISLLCTSQPQARQQYQCRGLQSEINTQRNIGPLISAHASREQDTQDTLFLKWWHNPGLAVSEKGSEQGLLQNHDPEDAGITTNCGWCFAIPPCPQCSAWHKSP